MAPIPNVQFKNGFSIPILGLGTWKSQPGEVAGAVKEAISCGYRHIDCAKCYENEKEVGSAIKAKIQDGTVKREELFITSKLWISYGRKELVIPILKKQLQDLCVDYLDLFLVHWPAFLKEGDNLFPKGSDGELQLSMNDYVDTWRGMEQAVREGLTKSIGVSNFNKRQMEKIMKAAEIPPVTNQVECHPFLSQKKLMDYCKSKGVVITAYSPLGSPDRPWSKPTDPVILDDPVVKKLAEKYNKNPGQILIKYHVENGTIVIPKSVTPSRIRSNFEVFDFQLTPAELQSLEDLNRDHRFIAFNLISKHPEYPFKDAY